MSAQQIRLNINTLVDSIEDESILDGCYEMLASFVKIARKQRSVMAITKEANAQLMPLNSTIQPLINNEESVKEIDDALEKIIPHDLSFVILANEIFKGSGPIPEEGAIAFKRALLRSATTEPTFTD